MLHLTKIKTDAPNSASYLCYNNQMYAFPSPLLGACVCLNICKVPK